MDTQELWAEDKGIHHVINGDSVEYEEVDGYRRFAATVTGTGDNNPADKFKDPCGLKKNIGYE